MNTKLLILAISSALLAAADALSRFADTVPDASQGLLELGLAPSITHTAVADAELDAAGLPWDARIHASTKTKTQKNVWTARKGVDDSVRDAVTAELRELYPDTTPVAAAPVAPAVPTAPVLTLVPPVVAAPVVKTNYTELVDWLAKNTGTGKILSDEWIKSAFDQNNVTLASLATDMDASATFLQAFRDALSSTGTAEA